MMHIWAWTNFLGAKSKNLFSLIVSDRVIHHLIGNFTKNIKVAQFFGIYIILGRGHSFRIFFIQNNGCQGKC